MSSESDQPPVQWAGALEKYLAELAYKFDGKWFNAQEIQLDGYSFSKCRFDSCTLVTNTGTFSLDHCFIYNCKIFFGQAAQKSVRLLAWGHELGYQSNEGVRPIANEDGTRTIP